MKLLLLLLAFQTANSQDTLMIKGDTIFISGYSKFKQMDSVRYLIAPIQRPIFIGDGTIQPLTLPYDPKNPTDVANALQQLFYDAFPEDPTPKIWELSLKAAKLSVRSIIDMGVNKSFWRRVLVEIGGIKYD